MSTVRRPRLIASSLTFAALGAVFLAGCPDPQASFDAFGDRYEKINGAGTTSSTGAGVGGGCMAPMPGVADGDYVFALSAKISPKKAVALLMNVTTVANGSGLKMTLKETPLSYMDQKTPAGPQVDLGTFDVAEDGTFTAAIGTITVPGAANPITKGSDITADVSITGSLCANDPAFVCGPVTGKVTAPIMLDLAPGSNFTMQKVEGGVLPPPVIDCAKSPAVYPP